MSVVVEVSISTISLAPVRPLLLNIKGAIVRASPLIASVTLVLAVSSGVNICKGIGRGLSSNLFVSSTNSSLVGVAPS